MREFPLASFYLNPFFLLLMQTQQPPISDFHINYYNHRNMAPQKRQSSTHKPLRTSDLAHAAGIHPNTVRRYEEWGLIPPAERAPNGYRRFTQRHVDCLQVARVIFAGDYAGRAIRQAATRIIQFCVADDWGGALEAAYQHQAAIQSEKAQALAAVGLLEHWARGKTADASLRSLRIKDAARLLGLNCDKLRNWERNGLLSVPREPANGYRLYGPEEISRLRVIRMLIQAGYSLMAILRMLTLLDRGELRDARQALDTPNPDEDVYMAADHWLTTLAAEEQRSKNLITLLEKILASRQ